MNKVALVLVFLHTVYVCCAIHYSVSTLYSLFHVSEVSDSTD
jgi:hypothetical protein